VNDASKTPSLLQDDELRFVLSTMPMPTPTPPVARNRKTGEGEVEVVKATPKGREVLRSSISTKEVAFLDQGMCVWLPGSGPESEDSTLNRKEVMAIEGGVKMNGDVVDGDKEKENADMEVALGVGLTKKGWFCRVNRWRFADEEESKSL